MFVDALLAVNLFLAVIILAFGFGILKTINVNRSVLRAILKAESVQKIWFYSTLLSGSLLVFVFIDIMERFANFSIPGLKQVMETVILVILLALTYVWYDLLKGTEEKEEEE